ncbi:hypothetical protein [Xanthomonas axonopodis]|nr:hypothetical protein [Xanthomonas axonopodis]
MTIRSGEPPAAVTTRAPLTGPLPPTLPTAPALPPLAADVAAASARSAAVAATLPGPRTVPVPAPPGVVCGPCRLRLATAAPSWTLGALRP